MSPGSLTSPHECTFLEETCTSRVNALVEKGWQTRMNWSVCSGSLASRQPYKVTSAVRTTRMNWSFTAQRLFVGFFIKGPGLSVPVAESVWKADICTRSWVCMKGCFPQSPTFFSVFFCSFLKKTGFGYSTLRFLRLWRSKTNHVTLRYLLLRLNRGE